VPAPLAALDARASRRTLAIVAVSATTFVWGAVGVLVKASALSGLTFAMYRLWLGVAVHVLALLVTRRRLTWATFKACAPGGALFALDISFNFTAVKLTTVANAAIIGAISPILILLVAGRTFGERVRRREALLAAASFAGVAIVAVGSSGSPAWSPVGDLLALCGCVSWTAYWIFSKRARQSVSALEYMTSVMLAGALTVTPLALVVGGVPPASPNAKDWAILVIVTLVPGMTGHLLVAWSHRFVESWLSALITQCSPVVSAVAAWLVLGESIPPAVVVGGAVVLGATGLVILSTARRERAAPDEVLEDELEAATDRAT
jgi:drug/metabolite transporter (DMT)-like permease